MFLCYCNGYEHDRVGLDSYFTVKRVLWIFVCLLDRIVFIQRNQALLLLLLLLLLHEKPSFGSPIVGSLGKDQG